MQGEDKKIIGQYEVLPYEPSPGEKVMIFGLSLPVVIGIVIIFFLLFKGIKE